MPTEGLLLQGKQTETLRFLWVVSCTYFREIRKRVLNVAFIHNEWSVQLVEEREVFFYTLQNLLCKKKTVSYDYFSVGLCSFLCSTIYNL